MKTDFKRAISTYTAPHGRFEVVTVAPSRFLMIDGQGDPNTSQAYRDALGALYPVAYGLKFFSKRELGRDYTVMPLEGLWWADDMDSFTSARDKSQWAWTLMNMVPDWITPVEFEAAVEAVEQKGTSPALGSLRLETLDEGHAVQTLHVGSYDDEAPLLDAMHHDFIPSQGLTMTGKHHEIYLSDPRRTASDRLKTILRQPVRR